MKRPILIFTLALFHGGIMSENMSVVELKLLFIIILLLMIFAKKLLKIAKEIINHEVINY